MFEKFRETITDWSHGTIGFVFIAIIGAGIFQYQIQRNAPVKLAVAHSDSLSVEKQLRLEVLSAFQGMEPQLIRLSVGEFDCNSEIDNATVQMMAFYIRGDLYLMKRESSLIVKNRTQ